jgi:glutamyl-tRNA reductase
MHRIAIAGLSVHETDVAGLERAKARLASAAGIEREIADRLGASELVVLSTCNRLELAFAREAGHLPTREDVDVLASVLALEPELARRFHFVAGRDAVRHLFRVAASLDSLVLGEDQILAQVRDAHRRATDELLVGKLLGALFQAAEHAGKEVRAKTELARRPISVATLALEHVERRFRGERPAIALWGAGEMARSAALGVRETGLDVAWVVSPTRERGERLAREAGARWLDADSSAARSLEIDVLVSATSAPGFVFSATELVNFAARAPLGTGLLALDLALPRDLEPCDDPRVEIVDLERLRLAAEANRAARLAAAADAERLIERQVELFTERDVGKRAAEALAELSTTTNDILEHELGGLFAGALADLDDERRRAIERWARQTFGRIEHAPIAAIKRLAQELAPRGTEPR